ncbi:MAG: 23S rRNA (uracil(1939)-C(5))-methyltransferase RlmD, partial [Eubacteriales bacterium]|nr:23S rRNA (uracil(1939)-C(5))-methyltransferase RlmD [Eubacteriales bacterium]
MKKGEEYTGKVIGSKFPNKGQILIGDDKVTVKNAIPGQTVHFRIQKKKSGRAEGRLLEVVEPSPLETEEPGCSIYPACGGCLYRTIPYKEQLEIKKNQVLELLTNAGIDTSVYEGIKPSPLPDRYRNKMEYSFGDSEKDGELMLGLHKRGSMYDVLPALDCHIVHEDFNRIVKCVLDLMREKGWTYYHKNSHEGYLRHLLIRRACMTGEILVDLVTSSQSPADEQQVLVELVRRLRNLSLDGNLCGILHTYNDSVADTIKNEHTDILYGQDNFYEEILQLMFKITPFSFFQTNSRGAEVLYKTAREFLGDKEVRGKRVFDLYSGTGTIAQILAPAAEEVVGVEIVEEAVEAARQNAMLNNLHNCKFIAGDVLKVLDEIEERPDTIVLDPPRDGIHPKALPKIVAYGVNRIIYISCKPTSLVRDLPYFVEHGYEVSRICNVDMFPDTPHVETVCLLSKLSGAKNTIDV